MLLVALLAVLSRPLSASPIFLDQNATTTAEIEEDQNVTIPALSHFTDTQELLTGAAIRIVDPPEFGTVTVDASSGNITYTSAANDYGNRTFSYQACNTAGNCTAPVNFTVVISSVNDPPFAVPPLVLIVLEDQAITLNLTAYYGDVEDDLDPTLQFPRVRPDSFQGPAQGNFTLTGDSLTYAPAENAVYNDSVTFTVCDSVNDCVNITVAVVVTPVNDPPVIQALGSPFATPEDTALDIDVLVTDVEDRSLVDFGVLSAENGFVVFNASSANLSFNALTGTLEQRLVIAYVPDLNFFGDDMVVVYAQDSEGGYTEANISVMVEHVNDPPVFGVVNVTVLEDTVVTLQLPRDLDVVDPEETLNAASFSIVSQPALGSLSYSYTASDPPPSFGTLVYTPIKGYYTAAGRPITFVIMACDSDATRQLCVNQTIAINITADRQGSASPFVPSVPKFDGEFPATTVICEMRYAKLILKGVVCKWCSYVRMYNMCVCVLCISGGNVLAILHYYKHEHTHTCTYAYTCSHIRTYLPDFSLAASLPPPYLLPSQVWTIVAWNFSLPSLTPFPTQCQPYL